MKRPGYLAEFLEFWTPRPEIEKVWFSLFTPQVGDRMPEILSSEERAQAIADMVELRKQHPKLDMPEAVIRQFASPPHRPQIVFCAHDSDRCRRTCRPRSLHASLAGILIARPAMHRIHGLASIAAHKLGGILSVGTIFKASSRLAGTEQV